jgi:peptidoglycan/LPS O-acetylase OafA/YrhL
MIAYRRDIDGLRALSVVAVILFHARVPGFRGGFVGVDVFFVISGYLITKLLLGAPGESVGSRLRDFYARRARRILPALLVVMFAILAVAMLIVMPRDLISLGKMIGFASLMLANVGAWLNIGYFTGDGAVASALHLWSIAVEEQFYLLYPLALLLVVRHFARNLRAVVLAGVLISFALCVLSSYRSPAANFYMMPTRAWELGLGALLALGVVPAFVRRHSQAVAGGALLVIAGSIFLCTPDLRWPGFATLPVALATTLLLATGEGPATVVARGLSARPLVFTGLISYSLYLWHAPVLALFVYYSVRKPDAWTLAALLAVIYLLSVASWKWIEKPVRTRRVLVSQTRFAMLALAGSLTVCAAGWALLRSDGLPGRFPEDVQRILNARIFVDDDIPCMKLSLEEVQRAQLCRRGSTDLKAPRMIVWGDSHALALLPALVSLAREHGFALYFAGNPACQPLFGSAPAPSYEVARIQCEKFNAAMLRAVEQIDPQLVVLAGYWRSWKSRDIRPDADVTGEDAREFARQLEMSARLLARNGRLLCAVRDVPDLHFDTMQALAMTRLRGVDGSFIRLPVALAAAQQAPYNLAIDALVQAGKVVPADPAGVLCTGVLCKVEEEGALLYRDRSHLTPAGAQFVAPALQSCWAGLPMPAAH